MCNLIKKILDFILRQSMSGIAYARYKGVSLGSGCRIYNKSWGSEPFLISIGDRVTITSGVCILTHDGATWLIRDNSGIRYQKYRRVIIGDDVFIGCNAIIMPGIVVGSRVVIGAGSVVTKNVDSDTVVAGNPARIVCSFQDFKNKIMLNEVCDSQISHIKIYKERVLRAVNLSDGGNID